MQVNSVSLNNSSKQSFGAVNRDFLENLANLDERTVRNLALEQASKDVNYKKHKRIDKAIMWSIPLMAGLAAAAKKPLSFASDWSRYFRLSNFVSTAFSWGLTFGVIDAVFGAKNKLDKHCDASKKFSQNHPILSSLGVVGASLLAVMGVRKGGAQLVEKLGTKVISKIRMSKKFKYVRSVHSFAAKLNNSKVLNKTSQLLSKVPSAIKEFGKGVLNWSPLLLIFASLSHSSDYSRQKSIAFAKNYNDIKLAQSLAAQAVNKTDAVEDAEIVS